MQLMVTRYNLEQSEHELAELKVRQQELELNLYKAHYTTVVRKLPVLLYSCIAAMKCWRKSEK